MRIFAVISCILLIFLTAAAYITAVTIFADPPMEQTPP
jgi:hypothetical protein